MSHADQPVFGDRELGGTNGSACASTCVSAVVGEVRPGRGLPPTPETVTSSAARRPGSHCNAAWRRECRERTRAWHNPAAAKSPAVERTRPLTTRGLRSVLRLITAPLTDRGSVVCITIEQVFNFASPQTERASPECLFIGLRTRPPAWTRSATRLDPTGGEEST